MKAASIIEPRVLKGFRDFLPASEIPKKAIVEKLANHFSSYGFVPIDTPALEYTEVLLGKGGGETDKQIFHFKDNGDRDVAMRFDLTVPFARFLAQHQSQLALPFKRFHIDKVWRGENPQKGRFREFTQCDFDIVGVDNAEADYEILSMMDSSFAVMGVENYQFYIAHRGLFNTFLSHLGVLPFSVEILRTVDKLRKIGEEQVQKNLAQLLQSEEKAQAILSYISKEDEGESFVDTLDRLVLLSGGESEHSQRMRKIYEYLLHAQIANHFTLDPSITRGLDYYTGIVYETFLTELPQFGSVCSGGRYNDLASLYTKEKLPGVGSSIGLDRLLAALEELNSPLVSSSGSADVAILNTGEDHFIHYDKTARALRSHGLKVAIYLSEKKIGAQYKWVESNAIPYTITLTNDDVNNQIYTLKEITSRQVFNCNSINEVLAHIKKERR